MWKHAFLRVFETAESMPSSWLSLAVHKDDDTALGKRTAAPQKGLHQHSFLIPSGYSHCPLVYVVHGGVGSS
eukprot:1169025-Alexandrium_andersonii.AAC.2